MRSVTGGCPLWAGCRTESSNAGAHKAKSGTKVISSIFRNTVLLKTIVNDYLDAIFEVSNTAWNFN